ncbi:post-PEP-CTERM-1 domain-containing protein [Luteibacter sp.]|jgi:Mg2+ and Co2+ transporter CorA|uniref:post-PEP-CTERM-1 domain-containing protein n=1 Tax=Luteibacter sp. TaxID=1886636 RepID=UPI003F7D6822
MYSRTLAQAVGLVLTGVFTLATAAQAADAPKTAAPQTVVVQGVQVAIDPATGRLREPTAEERAALSKAFGVRNATASKLAAGQPRTAAEAKSTFRSVSLGNGVRAKAVKVPQELMSSVVAERQPDGSLSIHHDDHGVQAAPKAPEVVK